MGPLPSPTRPLAGAQPGSQIPASLLQWPRHFLFFPILPSPLSKPRTNHGRTSGGTVFNTENLSEEKRLWI